MSDQIRVESFQLPNLPEYFEFKETIVDMSSTPIEVNGEMLVKEGYIKIVEITDTRTGIKILRPEMNSLVDFCSTTGWASATFSRSHEGYVGLVQKIAHESKTSPEYAAKKLATTYINYGHNSVADLIVFPISFENIPILNVMEIFANESTGAGQETSTRYYRIKNGDLMPLNAYIDDPQQTEILEALTAEYQSLGEALISKYNEWYPRIEEAHREYITNGLGEMPPEERESIRIQESTIKARTLDVARRFLPVGIRTNMIYGMSARMWIDLVVYLKERNDPETNKLAEQLEAILNITKTEEGKDFKGELDVLTKYSGAKNTIRRNTKAVAEYIYENPNFQELIKSNEVQSDQPEIEGQKTQVTLFSDLNDAEILALQYISTILTNVSDIEIAAVIKRLSDEELDTIIEKIVMGHGRHNNMRTAADNRGGVLFNLKIAMADARDFIRHRALGRFMKILQHDDVLSAIRDGFNQNYQIHSNPSLRKFSEAWDEEFKQYYSDLEKFYNKCREALGGDADLRFIYNLLPLNHQVDLSLTGPIGQLVYFFDQRIAPGGDISYRKAAYDMLNRLRSERGFGKLLLSIEDPDSQGLETWASRK